MWRLLLFWVCGAAWAQPMVSSGGVLSRVNPAPASGKGVIEGTVIDGSTHEPIKKAQVQLGGALPSPAMAVTDLNGHFLFRGLPPGPYLVSASKPGYNPPHDVLGVEQNPAIHLGTDEEKKGVEIALLPGGVISGHVVDEDGLPVRNCWASASERSYEQGRPELHNVGGGNTDAEKGAYRISGVQAGRYYVFVRCGGAVPMPHPLLPRGDARIPYETYVPQFYGGGLDPATATRLTLAPGANLEGIDFQVRRVPAFTLQGNITGDSEAVSDRLAITLMPANRLLRDVLQFHARRPPRSSTFQFHGLLPGSYLLIVASMRSEHSFYAERTVQVGNTAPEPVEIALNSGAELKGAVQFDSEDHPALEHGQVWLMPVDLSARFFRPQPRTDIAADGSFTLNGVFPGRWRIMVNTNGLSYVKSLSIGGQQVSPYGFEIAPGAAGPLRIVMGTKMSDVQVKIGGARVEPDHPLSLMIYPEDADRFGIGMERIAQLDGDQGGFGGMAPGLYRVLATDAPNPWSILQRPDLMKALESHTQEIELSEGGQANVTVGVTPREELMRALENKE